MRLMRRHLHVRLRIVGFLSPDASLRAFADRIELLPLTDVLTLQRLIGTTDVNIVPLQTNTFTDSKSELKYFEAAATRTPTFATPTYTFRAAITHGVNGYLVNAYDWDDALGAAVRGDLRLSEVSANAEKHARSAYTPATQVEAIHDTVMSRHARYASATSR